MKTPSFLTQLHENAIHADECTDPDERANAHRVERLFTGCVDTLRNLEDDEIRAMAADAWKVIEHKHVLMALHPSIPTLTMAILAEKGIKHGYIFIPHNWAAMVAKDPTRQLGAVAFVCSQAVDSYNEVDIQTIKQRAVAYEGALLRMMEPSDPDEWQREAMSSPSLSTFSYSHREVVLPS